LSRTNGRSVSWVNRRSQLLTVRGVGTWRQQFKTVKVLAAAFLAWMALSYALQHQMERLDGGAAHEPSMMERIVAYLSK